MNKIALGSKIWNLRKSLGLSQGEFCTKSGVALNSLKAIESGKGNPTLDTLEAIADTFKISLIELLTDSEGAKPKTYNDAIDSLATALADRGATIIPTEELEQLKASQIKSPELAEIIKMIDEFGDKHAYKRILRRMNISMENFALYFDLVDPNKPKAKANQESRPQTPPQETEERPTQKKSS